MIPKECKRLAEVDFPIAEVSRHAMREKSIRHGHPSTLHLWWARRPLAACRAMLLALLLPDPIDPYCPDDFKGKARELLTFVQQKVDGDEGLRKGLLKFIGDFANWDLASNSKYLEVSRGLVRAAYPEETPLVVDPFAGGGSIPLEAIRLGCDGIASDINPISNIILRVMLEDLPRLGDKKIIIQQKNGALEVNGMVEALYLTGQEIKRQAENELEAYYPTDPDGGKPIAYIWARTVKCETPNCGAEIPLVKSYWLCKKDRRKLALRYKIIREPNIPPEVQLSIFSPKNNNEVPPSTVKNARAICPACGRLLQSERVVAQLANQKGGANVIFDSSGKRIGGALLLAVVKVVKDIPGRHYRLAEDHDYQAIHKAQQKFELIKSNLKAGNIDPIPTEPLPTPGGITYKPGGLYYNFFPLVRYGLETWGDFFSIRQNVSLFTFCRIISTYSEKFPSLLLALGKLIDLSNVVCPWEPIAECPRNVLSNGRVKPSWNYAEGVPISSSGASFTKCLENLCAGLNATIISQSSPASVFQIPAQNNYVPDGSVSIWFTDPPYYDAIPYAYLSDAFWVWIKRAIPNYKNKNIKVEGIYNLTPKTDEIIDDLELLRGYPKDKAIKDGIPAKDRYFFETSMAVAFEQGQRSLAETGIGCVVFAHKTTEGWEALLSGMIKGGLVITSSWPIATEMAHRLRARESAALTTSVHLVCRPRSEDASIGDWSLVSRELPRKVRDWMERLQNEKVRGADLVFACIGPALEIYSRYSKVVDAQDREIPLGGDPEAKEPYQRGYLAYVWEVVGRMALEQVLGTLDRQARERGPGALEEDARLTALFLWTKQSTGNGDQESKGTRVQRSLEEEAPEEEVDEDEEDTPKKKISGGYSLPFDVVRRFAQPLGIHLPEWEGRIIETEKGVVRLLTVTERAKQLFGEEGAEGVATEMERRPAGVVQLSLFPGLETTPRIKATGRGRIAKSISDEALRTRREATTLDRVHAAMLLQKSGRTNALRALLRTEVERGAEFLRLANALSALYPKESEEKRLLDAMLLSVGR